MKKISKILAIFAFFLLAFSTFYGCKLSKYKITFKSEQIKYLSEKAYKNTKIPYGKEAHFEVIVPEGKEIKTIKIDGNELDKKLISNNRFTIYNVTKSQNIEVEYQDLVNKLVIVELSGGVTFADDSVRKEVALNSKHKLEIPYRVGGVEKILASFKVNDQEVVNQVQTLLYATHDGYHKGVYNLNVDKTLVNAENKIVVVANLVAPIYQNITLPAEVSEEFENKTSNFLVGQTYRFRVNVPNGKEIKEVKVNDTVVKHSLNENIFYYKVENKTPLNVTVTFKEYVLKHRLDLPAEVTLKEPTTDNIVEHDKTYRLVIKPSDGKQVKELKVDNQDYISQYFKDGEEIVFDLKVKSAHKVTVAFEDKKANQSYKITLKNDTLKFIEFFDNVKPDELYTPRKVVFKLAKERDNHYLISVTVNNLPIEKQADGNYFFYLNRNVTVSYNSRGYNLVKVDKDSLPYLVFDKPELFPELGPEKLSFSIKNGTKIGFQLKDIPEGQEIDLLKSTPKLTVSGTHYEFEHDKEDQTVKIVLKRKTFTISLSHKIYALAEFSGSITPDGLTITKVEYGTVIKFKPIDATLTKVQLDGENLVANSEGLFEFTVKNNHNLVFSA